MAFSMSDFVRENRKPLTWLAFGILLYFFRDMFGLVFITYIMCFLAHGTTTALSKVVKVRRGILIAAFYALFLFLITGFLFFVVPMLLAEARAFSVQLPAAIGVIDSWAQANAAGSAILAPALEYIREYLTPEQMILKGWSVGRALLEKSFQYTSWFLLGLMFSFLIMLDLPRLSKSVQALRTSRLAPVYEETADSVVLFAKAVGENFRAQMLISALDTVLASIGLLLLGVNGVALLAALVFVCGLVPVLGGFISAVPIFLMAVNSGGVMLGVWSMAMMIGISIVEAYYFNPRIVSSVMQLNPVMTLIILYIAYNLMGMWGMVLGVPIAVYLYSQFVVLGASRLLP